MTGREEYAPQVGDRVRVTLVGTVLAAPKAWHGGFSLEPGPTGSGWRNEIRMHEAVELVERPAPVEEWQPGDVVRNADDPEDKRVWIYYGADDEGDPSEWVDGTGDLLPRGNLPANLRLLVRDGLPVDQPDAKGTDVPQPGDVVTEEPPVGSAVLDEVGDEATRDKGGWYWSALGADRRSNASGSRWSWYDMGLSGADVTLVRWGLA